MFQMPPTSGLLEDPQQPFQRPIRVSKTHRLLEDSRNPFKDPSVCQRSAYLSTHINPFKDPSVCQVILPDEADSQNDPNVTGRTMRPIINFRITFSFLSRNRFSIRFRIITNNYVLSQDIFVSWIPKDATTRCKIEWSCNVSILWSAEYPLLSHGIITSCHHMLEPELFSRITITGISLHRFPHMLLSGCQFFKVLIQMKIFIIQWTR